MYLLYASKEDLILIINFVMSLSPKCEKKITYNVYNSALENSIKYPIPMLYIVINNIILHIYTYFPTLV